MPKKLIIASESSNLYTTKRFLAEGKKLKWSTDWLCPYNTVLATSSHNEKNGAYLIRTTGTRYDDFDLVCAKNHQLNNYKIINPIDGAIFFRSKENQALFFKEHKIDSIPSIMYRGNLTENLLNQLQQLSTNEKYIIKMSRGNQGIGVNLINGMQSLKSLLETFHALKDQRFLIQPYIAHKKELRILIIKNEIHAIVEKSIATSDFRGNAKRSTGKIIKNIPLFLKNEILRVISLSKLDYCGIDLIFSPKANEFYFLEINAVPGFEQVEVLSKKNIAKEILLNL